MKAIKDKEIFYMMSEMFLVKSGHFMYDTTNTSDAPPKISDASTKSQNYSKKHLMHQSSVYAQKASDVQCTTYFTFYGVISDEEYSIAYHLESYQTSMMSPECQTPLHLKIFEDVV